MNDPIITCLNCGNHFEGNFCPICGQEASTRRFTFSLIIMKLVNTFDVEHGMMFIIRELTARPGSVIKQYLNGRRKPIYDPLRYLFWTTALMSILNVIIDPQNANMAKIEVDGVVRNINLWTTSNMNAMFLISLPIYALMTKWFFREWKLNFSEHLIVNMYAIGHANLFNSLVTLTLYWSKFHAYMTFIVMIGVPMYFYISLTQRKRFGTFLKSFFASGITTILFFVPFALLFILDMHVFKGALGLFPQDLIQP